MELFIQILTAFIFAFGAIKLLQPIATDIGLVDKPNERKTHKGHIPLIGGISIFLSVLASCLLWLPVTLELRMFLIASAMMVFIGALDDKYNISVRIRIVGQIIIASLMIYGVGGHIANLGDLFGVGEIKLGIMGMFFTYFCIVVAINAFNMIDGIDGLIGCLSLNTFIALALLFFINGDYTYISYPVIIATAIIPYLMFNLGVFKNKSQKIFMGDAGSMFIGLAVIWLLCMGTQGEHASFRPVTALWICAVPLMDMLTIVIRRLKKGKSPFKPDRDHLHHRLQRAGYCPKITLLLISSASIVLTVFGVISEFYKVPEVVMMFAFLAVFVAYNIVLPKIKYRK